MQFFPSILPHQNMELRLIMFDLRLNLIFMAHSNKYMQKNLYKTLFGRRHARASAYFSNLDFITTCLGNGHPNVKLD